MSFDTPLRYPGGKGRLANYVAEIIRMNDLQGGVYAEPFAGGSGIAISLLKAEYVRSIHINDLDRCVYAFWHTVLHDGPWLCEKIKSVTPTLDIWHQHREVLADKENADLADLGFATFFLNRTNRSGILTGGVIGGLQQTGKWKIDARYNAEDLAKRVKAISDLAPRIRLTNLDVMDFIDTSLAEPQSRTFVYFDPPYVGQGKALYKNHFKGTDHKTLAKAIQERVQVPWILSYDNDEEIADLYEDRDQEIFSLNYSAQGHYVGRELMIFADGLQIPQKVYHTRSRVA